MSQPSYAVLFRGLWACPCQVIWIPAFERHLNRVIAGFHGTLAIAQLIGLFEGSSNTHGDPDGDGLRKGGGESDFWVTGHLADLVVAEARQMGGDPTWHRGPGWDGPDSDEHVHNGLRGCPHRTVEALAQEWAVDHNGDGLVGDAPDPGPRPLSGRTWQQGIEWAEEQAMADYAGQLDRIEKALAGNKRRDVALRKMVKGVSDQMDGLTDAIGTPNPAILNRIRKAKAEVLEAIAELDADD